MSHAASTGLWTQVESGRSIKPANLLLGICKTSLQDFLANKVNGWLIVEIQLAVSYFAEVLFDQ